MSLLASIPGLQSHLSVVPDQTQKPATKEADAAPGLPHHWIMVSRNGQEYVLAGDDEHVAALVAAYPDKPVAGPAEIEAVRGFGQEAADWLMRMLAAYPGARVASVKRLGETVGERQNLRLVR